MWLVALFNFYRRGSMKTRDNTGKFTYCGEVVMRRGYPMLYLPNHHRAKANGYVFEHIAIAERELGRELLDNEVVHHIDGDKTNNHPNNLKVFSSNNDHVREHWRDCGVRYKCNGKMLTLPELVEISGLPYHRIYQRIHKLGWSAERAVAE